MHKTRFTHVEVIVMICGLLAVGGHFHNVVKQMLLEPNLLDFAYYYIWGELVDKGINYLRLASLTPLSLEFLNSSTNIPIPHIQHRLISTFIPHGFALYSPSFLSFMSLFARMDFVVAATLWTLMNYAALIASILVLAKVLDIKMDSRNAFILSSIIFFFQPLVECIAIGQANLLILFLLSTGLWAITREKPFFAGFLIACALHIKPQYGMICLLLFVKRQHTPLISTICFYCVIALSTLPIVSLQFQVDYFSTLLTIGEYASKILMWQFNLSLLSALTRLLDANHIIVARIIHGMLTLAVTIYLISLLWRPYHHNLFVFEFSSVILMTLLFLPVTEEHYFVLLYLSIFVIYRYLGSLDRLWQSAFIIAFLLLAMRYSVGRFDLFHSGFPSLLANGKLYGLILLTAINFRCWVTVRKGGREQGALVSFL
jgi:Glycosyltransferase family 87